MEKRHHSLGLTYYDRQANLIVEGRNYYVKYILNRKLLEIDKDYIILSAWKIGNGNRNKYDNVKWGDERQYTDLFFFFYFSFG